MSKEENPGGGVISVASRTNSILQARVREAQFNELQTLRRSGALDGAMFIHLTKDLDAETVPFEGATDVDEQRQQASPTTTYGVDREVQRQLAAVRTDLDSFSDAEAYALMMSAYLMTERAFLEDQCAPTLPLDRTTADWQFLRVRDALTAPESPDNRRMRRLLKVSPQLATKVWRQSRVLGGTVVVAVVAGLIAWVMTLAAQWKQVPAWLTTLGNAAKNAQLPTVGTLTYIALGIGLLIGLRFAFDKWLHWQKRFGEVLLGFALMTAGLVAAWLHLTIFDQIFLWYGQWPEKKSAMPPAIANPGSPHLPIKTPAPAAAARKREWTPIVRRVLNLFQPPR
jgi:hypothetical protein